ncbi:MAG TPA: hypothetical protein VIM73_22890 [Polyangiaceae bacterium]
MKANAPATERVAERLRVAREKSSRIGKDTLAELLSGQLANRFPRAGQQCSPAAG